jgi:hypothetical protein
VQNNHSTRDWQKVLPRMNTDGHGFFIAAKERKKRKELNR